MPEMEPTDHKGDDRTQSQGNDWNEERKPTQHITTQPPVEILHDDQDPTQNETNNEVIDEEVKLILKVVYMKASNKALTSLMVVPSFCNNCLTDLEVFQLTQ